MRDRQIFKTYVLQNGIRFFHYPADFPFAILHIILPFGHAHNTGDILPGTAHFLEHMAASHSRLYPRRHAFTEWVGLQGGYANAQTGNFNTIYLTEIPLASAETAWAGLCSQVFEPLFRPEDIAVQRTIVASERRRKERWFPGSNELTHYLKTAWERDLITDLRQIFGTNADLEKMDPENLSRFQAYYLDSRVAVLTAGNLNMQKFSERLMNLPVKTHEPPARYETPHWVKKEYHEREFNDVSQPILYIGALFPELPDYSTKVAMEFIGDYLTNSDHGPLYHWLRTEKGWIYGMSFKTYFERDAHWHMTIPLHEKEQVGVVQEEIFERMLAAVRDKHLVGLEVGRKLGAQTFHFQTLESIVAGAEYDLELYGKIMSETEYRSYLETCRDTDYLRKIFERYFARELWGEFCALPKPGT